jgi:hypothetical protein
MIATVIHYCTNEYRFLKKVVEEASYFSQKIVIVTCDHFFNGESEQQDLLHQTYQEFPNVLFFEFAYYPNRLYNPYLTSFASDDPEWGSLWHATSRYIATLFMPEEIEYALFLDSDEVIDGKRFSAWLESETYRSYSAFRLGCYLYAHHASLRATKLFTSALWVQMKKVDPSLIINIRDRCGWFTALPDPKKKLLDSQGEPFIHHYSWVRSKEECQHKAKTWGHRLDKEWLPLIDQMFLKPSSSDLLNLGIEFEEVTSVYFDPLSLPIQKIASSAPVLNVLKIDETRVRNKELERLLC